MNTKLNKMQEALKSLDEAARLHITSTKNFNPDLKFLSNRLKTIPLTLVGKA
jgi:hypothetical protein